MGNQSKINNIVLQRLKHLIKLSINKPFETMAIVLLLCLFSYMYLLQTINFSMTSKDINSIPEHNPIHVYVNDVYGRQEIQEDMIEDNPIIIIKQFILRSQQNMMKRDSLASVLAFQRHIENDFLKNFCFHNEKGGCFIKSPLIYWDYDIHKLYSDKDIKRTIKRKQDYEHYFLMKNNNYANGIVLSYVLNDSYSNNQLNRWEYDIIQSENNFFKERKQSQLCSSSNYLKFIYKNAYQTLNTIESCIILTGHVFMIITLISLFYNMKKIVIESQFLLTFAIILNGIFALIFGVFTTIQIFKIEVTISLLM
ncbi:uncharacterized protein BX663DRAFT_142909 [Cokeromyces recurvatus]|uniref:uncharacterized protein n=1 Tax=Cokeromyces recurvatus TaxID=90255 RepID=UPI002220D402|nr:uncharacterized protein BX663DRAFT_142909 [Cokeromyces recurvatus]KAI7901028.1 hypothetical protein BX663DRAFT_142909 [Cokeromyces recurvatus]